MAVILKIDLGATVIPKTDQWSAAESESLKNFKIYGIPSPNTKQINPSYSRGDMCMPAKSPQPCPTLCDPMDCSLPGSSVHGILQARILSGFHAFFQGISWPMD